MSKKKPPHRRERYAASQERSPQAGRRRSGRLAWGLRAHVSPEAIREVIESVVIAFVLAFLFRTFEAEAFVIPTGSMAPTLMGRHKDLVCDECGMPFQLSASDEVTPETNELTQTRVVGGTCPNCRYTTYFGTDNDDYPFVRRLISILVTKFAYQIAEPKRWDVAVFHYPDGAKTNFIKRLVGLPNETLRIHHGDLWFRHEGEQDFHIARKPPEKVLAMLQVVYDNGHLPGPIRKDVWQPRWAPQTSGRQGDWRDVDDHHLTFQTAGASARAGLAPLPTPGPLRRRLGPVCRLEAASGHGQASRPGAAAIDHRRNGLRLGGQTRSYQEPGHSSAPCPELGGRSLGGLSAAGPAARWRGDPGAGQGRVVLPPPVEAGQRPGHALHQRTAGPGPRRADRSAR